MVEPKLNRVAFTNTYAIIVAANSGRMPATTFFRKCTKKLLRLRPYLKAGASSYYSNDATIADDMRCMPTATKNRVPNQLLTSSGPNGPCRVFVRTGQC